MVGGGGELVVRYGTPMVGRAMVIAALLASCAQKSCVQIVLNAANLPVALVTNTADIVSDDLALITCATDACKLASENRTIAAMAVQVGALQLQTCAVAGE